jgi:peptidoglycan-associated lipoprotein
MKRVSKLIVAVLPLVLLAACASTGDKAAAPTAAPEPTQTETMAPEEPSAETEAAPMQPRMEVDPLQDPTSPLAKRVIYFDFDKSDIKSEYRPILQAHAEYLANHQRVHVRLEGHADERGTREYNIGLGERRANSVRAYLTLQGVSASQIETISYGEERPVAMGHDESSWRLNRRVEIVYQ